MGRGQSLALDNVDGRADDAGLEKLKDIFGEEQCGCVGLVERLAFARREKGRVNKEYIPVIRKAKYSPEARSILG
jgi:hypothetical protein